ncbi:MAG: hypothetical protein GX753_05385 [Erysipelothrix sp.]|nr:hypothetical protein [Erysipelothrix sp.]
MLSIYVEKSKGSFISSFTQIVIGNYVYAYYHHLESIQFIRFEIVDGILGEMEIIIEWAN